MQQATEMTKADKNRLKARVATAVSIIQAKISPATHYTPYITAFYPQYDDVDGKKKLQQVVNLRIVDEEITIALEDVAKRIKKVIE